MQRILGIPEEHRVEKLILTFHHAFYDPKTRLYSDNPEKSHSALHSNVLPVFYGIAPKESWDPIKDLIMEKGFSCGVQFAYFVLKALGKMGYHQEEFALLTNQSSHSWNNMLREGATTCFEAWGKDQKWNTSLCHPWACAPIIVLVEDFAEDKR